MSKPGMRARLASLSFSEKINILEKLRDRSSALALVKVFLIARANDPNADDQEKMREKLEPDAQRYLSAHLKAGPPNASRVVLHVLLQHWLLGRGRKVRFELEVDGKIKAKELMNVEELDALIGKGRTSAELLRAIGSCPETDGRIPAS
jgi:hypothetical protein